MLLAVIVSRKRLRAHAKNGVEWMPIELLMLKNNPLLLIFVFHLVIDDFMITLPSRRDDHRENEK